jgi:hypothetical protein
MSKLTLSIEESTVARAKQYAKAQGISLSSLVESYLAVLSKPISEQENAPILKSLRGSLRAGKTSDYRKHLLAKYK